jgi:DNA-binding NarL/FixJ family response regulator
MAGELMHQTNNRNLENRSEVHGAGFNDVENKREMSRAIVIIEDRLFLRECFRRAVQSVFALPIIAFPTIAILEQKLQSTVLELIIVCLAESTGEAIISAVSTLNKLVPSVPIVFLSENNNSDLARTAIFNGAKGCIPLTMDFRIGIHALRFVLAGGTYVPIEYLMESAPIEVSSSHLPPSEVISKREMEIIRGIQEGKPNSVIAKDMSISGDTIKLHLCQLVKKIKTRIACE